MCSGKQDFLKNRSCPLTLYFATNAFKKKYVILYWKKKICHFVLMAQSLRSLKV